VQLQEGGLGALRGALLPSVDEIVLTHGVACLLPHSVRSFKAWLARPSVLTARNYSGCTILPGAVLIGAKIRWAHGVRSPDSGLTVDWRSGDRAAAETFVRTLDGYLGGVAT
jgi:hypothetical protein